uniref:Uncharacterized protein K02A2.6 n=1 Tax=Schistocephalus solidus TaxID=70667 RepID=A0A0X3NWZ7_SCHSO
MTHFSGSGKAREIIISVSTCYDPAHEICLQSRETEPVGTRNNLLKTTSKSRLKALCIYSMPFRMANSLSNPLQEESSRKADHILADMDQSDPRGSLWPQSMCDAVDRAVIVGMRARVIL